VLGLLDAGLPDGVVGFFTTRYGGISTDPWAELNLALHVEDQASNVMANRDVLAERLRSGSVSFPQQVHGTGVLTVDAAMAGRVPISRDGAPGIDALVTAVPETPIGVLAADCLPVLLADAERGVVAAAHAGRRGLAAGVLQATLAEMTANGARATNCRAVIGPAICGRCYEVPAEMREEVARQVPGSAATTSAGTPSLDLPAGAEQVLRRAGVGEVVQTGICTLTDERFYSYRRDGVTGRFAGVVMLSRRHDNAALGARHG
jgi:hypothetical protein